MIFGDVRSCGVQRITKVKIRAHGGGMWWLWLTVLWGGNCAYVGLLSIRTVKLCVVLCDGRE